MGSDHQSETTESLKTNPAHEKKLSTASSSSSSSFEEVQLSLGGTASPNHVKDPQLTSKENVDRSGNESTLNTKSARESPGTMQMERPADPAANPAYRIPSAVFASKSSGPNEWSIASNESLFSIHMGNMSFTQDQSWLGKSGELGLMGDFPMPGGPLSPVIELSSKRYFADTFPNKKSGEIEQPTKEKAAEAMMEIIKENGADADKQKSNAGNSHQSASFRRSDVSGASVKSFAFPILTGEHKMDNSSKQNASSPITPKASQEQDLQQKSQEGTSNPEPSNKPPNAGPSKWFSCLPCFSSRN